MKLRILGNSIRLRLTQTEVREFADGKAIREQTQFSPDTHLIYELITTTEEAFSARFQDHKISLALPQSIGIQWAEGSDISLRKTLKVDSHNSLSILIEKDFKCKTERVGENETDMFPNPEC